MSDYLSLREMWRFRQGEIVRVRTRALWPEIDGIFQLGRVFKTSNFPYRIWFDNQELLIHKDEVYKAGELSGTLRDTIGLKPPTTPTEES